MEFKGMGRGNGGKGGGGLFCAHGGCRHHHTICCECNCAKGSERLLRSGCLRVTRGDCYSVTMTGGCRRLRCVWTPVGAGEAFRVYAARARHLIQRFSRHCDWSTPTSSVPTHLQIIHLKPGALVKPSNGRQVQRAHEPCSRPLLARKQADHRPHGGERVLARLDELVKQAGDARQPASLVGLVPCRRPGGQH